MGVPTRTEHAEAIKAAVRMREEGADPHFIAKTLLNLNYRMELMEKVLYWSKLYLRSGHGSKEHAMLLKAIENVDKASVMSTDDLESPT
jgi:hypothetical protein